LIVTGIAFLAQYMVIGFTDRMAMVPLLLAHGEWWRLLTPALVHGGGFHFIMNGYVLFMIGPAVEQRYGVARFVAIYVMAAIGGSVASFAFNEINIFGVGASGAILGLIGAFMADLYQRRNFANARLQLAGMWRWLGMIFGIGIAFQILSELGMRFFLIDNFAHAGGLVMGAAIGYGLGTKESKGRSAAIFVAVAVIALYAGLFVWRVASITS
jgi:rhomboid protease GluP